jgi:hypothetical protein
VCSAYGYAGQGATWDLIDQSTFDYLPAGWKDRFRNNAKNITQDLKTILGLIDDVARSINDSGAIKSFTIRFKDIHGNELVKKDVNSSFTDYEVAIGRDISFSING